MNRAQATPDMRQALIVAKTHIDHMAAWISRTNASDVPVHGYSFEALGEDKWIIDQALAATSGDGEVCEACGHSGPVSLDKIACCPDGKRDPSPASDVPLAEARQWVEKVAIRDAAVAYRARIACDILEGFTDGIDGDRLGEVARWVTRGRALDDAALHRFFAAPWIAAAEEGAWEGDPDVEARKDIDRHTIAARVLGVTSFTPDHLATILTRQNQLRAAAKAVSAIRPTNWNDGEDPKQQQAWTALDEALK